MRLIFSLLGRLITIFFAVVCSFIAVLLMLAAGAYLDLLPQFEPEKIAQLSNQDIYDLFLLAVYYFETVSMISVRYFGAVGVPLLTAIIACELMQWRSLVSYFLLGAAVSIFSVVSQLPQGAVLGQGTITIMLALGFTGGFIYWVIAGRRAGVWMRYLSSETKSDA